MRRITSGEEERTMSIDESTFHDVDSLQDRVAPENTCFGCGPANPDGLQLKSYLSEDETELIGFFEPDPKHNAGRDILCGGIVGTLVDCHSLWTAGTFARLAEGYSQDVNSDELDFSYITGEFSVQLKQPTPLDQPLQLTAWIEGDIGEKTHVRCELGPEDDVTATGEITAIRLDEPW